MKCYVVDAFADKVFEGNPAGVCILQEWLPDSLMLNIARENNFSETAFAVPMEGGYHLRWFTPAAEIDLCGHATLATAYVILRFVQPDADRVAFQTLSGTLVVTRKGNLLEMDFPAIDVQPYPCSDQLVAALGKTPVETYRGRDLICLYESEQDIHTLTPVFEKIKNLPDGLAVFVCAPSGQYDFVARSFWPKLGINEDPVTGSMYCSLAPFWSNRQGLTQMIARQLSVRGGTVHLEYCGDRVKIAGSAVLYAISNLQPDL